VKIRVENAYSDGHESTLEYDIPEADVPAPVDEMWDYLWDWTGDGHGQDPDLGWFYKITILEAVKPGLAGLSRENCGN
jgi:hypothetical protein